jgi:hypothetical protein
LKHFASPEFWHYYRQLPQEVRKLADQKFELLKTDPRHFSLRLNWAVLGPHGLAFTIERWPSSASMTSFGSGSARTARTINLNRHTSERNFVGAGIEMVNLSG